MPEEVAGEESSSEAFRERVAAVNGTAGGGAAGRGIVNDVHQMPVGIRVVQRSVLAEALEVVCALVSVPEEAEVRGVEQVAVVVECEAEDVPAALAEQFEFLRGRVIAPHALLKLDAPNSAGRGAAVESIQPAVRSPGEVVGERLRVLHAEATEQDFGVAIRHVVAVSIRIEEQVRCLEDVNSALAEFDPGTEIQPLHEVLERIGLAVAVRVFADGNAVRAPGTLRRWFGHPIVNRARPPIDLHALQPGRVGVLQVLNRPDPTAIIALHEDGLPHIRFGREELHGEPIGGFHPLRGFRGSEATRIRSG